MQELSKEDIQSTRDWVNGQLENMNPGESFQVPTPHSTAINQRTLRSKVSRINRQADTNIKVHKAADGALWVWSDPSPRPTSRKTRTGALLDRLLALQKEQKELIALANRTVDPTERTLTMNRAADMQDDIRAVLEQMQTAEPTFKAGAKGKIWCPLEQVLKHLGITKDIWDLLEPSEQTRRRIKAQVELKKLREQSKQNEGIVS